MTLGERIKAYRQKAGMSQEKLAALAGVSRQAVTKWESDQSAPSTGNLFKLAEIFGTTVDLLLDSGENQSPVSAEEIYQHFKREEEAKLAGKRKKRKERITAAAGVIAAYLIVYLAGRLIWCSASDVSLLGWLAQARPSGEHSYLYGWLLSSRLFWIAMGVSAVPALFGRYRFSCITFAAFVLGLVLGIFLGPYPPGAPYGHGDYGWAIWGGVWLLSIVAGIFAEHLKNTAVRREKEKFY